MVAGVAGEDGVAQVGLVQVQVDFGGGQTFMAEHHLDGTQVGPAFEKVCRKGVAQRVRRDRPPYPGFCGEILDDVKNHDTGEASSATVEEKNVLFAGLHLHKSAFGHVVGDTVD